VETKGRLVYPSKRPGLGVEINEAEIAKHPFEQEIPRRSYGRDGSVIDW
jgi:galactonate dehydratase